MEIYIARSGQQIGPFSERQIQSMLDSGMVTLGDSAWRQGISAWLPLHQILEFCPPLPAQPPAIPAPTAAKSKGVAYPPLRPKFVRQRLPEGEGAKKSPACKMTGDATRPSRFSLWNLPSIYERVVFWFIATVVISFAYSLLSVAVGGSVRWVSMAIVLVAESILAFLAYWALRKWLSLSSVFFLILIPSVIALIGGWIVEYRAAAGSYSHSLWYQANELSQKIQNRELSSQESKALWNEIVANPELPPLVHKIAAEHAVPAFAMVFAVMFVFLRKQRNE